MNLKAIFKTTIIQEHDMKITFMMIVMLFVSFSNLVYAQDNSSQTLENNLILDLIKNQNTLRENMSKNSVLLEDTRKELEKNEFETKKEFERIEENSRNEFFITLAITVFSVIGSGYLGWHVHKKEFNSELAKMHFTNIKEKILPQIESFQESLDRWHDIGLEITCVSVEEIRVGKTLELNILRERKNDKNKTWFGTLDVDLFVDLIENHYPILSKIIEQSNSLGMEYNKKRKNLIEEIKNELSSEINKQYLIVLSQDTLIRNDEAFTDGRPKNSIIIDILAQFLGSLIISESSFEEINIQRHRDGFAINISTPSIDGGRILYPNLNDNPHDETLLKGYCKKILENNKIIKEGKDVSRIFNSFKTQVDTLHLTLQKIMGKQIPKINKKWLIKSACPYIKDEL